MPSVCEGPTKGDLAGAKEGTLRKSYFSWNVGLGENQGRGGTGGRSSLPRGFSPCRGVRRSQGATWRLV